MRKDQKHQEAMPLNELQMILQLYGLNYGHPPGPNYAYCDVCGHDFSSARSFDKHLQTKKHDKEVQRLNLALDLAEQSGRLDDFRDAWRSLNSLPRQASEAEHKDAYQKAWAVLMDILGYWKINHAAANTMKSAPPISL